MSRRRHSYKQQIVRTLGKILIFDWDLFVTDPLAPPLTKRDLRMDADYLILRGNFSGRIARYTDDKLPTIYGMFKDTRNTQIRVRCDQKGWGCLPKLGCWMERIDCTEIDFNRPPILLLQACSIVGAPLTDELHVAIRERRDLIAQFSYRRYVVAETINLPRLEETIYDLANHKKAHKSLKDLIDLGFYVCYEDDGWLFKCTPHERVRWMRRSHIIQATICRCGQDIMDALFDDVTLRTLLPCRLFAGFIGVKAKARDGTHARCTSSIMSTNGLGFDISDFMGDVDRSMCYRRIFRRANATKGNMLVQDSQFMDAIRSWVENGGQSKNVVVPNVVKWRYMIKSAASGDDPYYLMENLRIAGVQWKEACNALPNSTFKSYSFSVVYYDATVKIDSAKIAHKVLRIVKPKEDIEQIFERQILMSGGYAVIAMSRKGVRESKSHKLFRNIESYVYECAHKHQYEVKKIATGIYYGNMIFVDFQVFRKYTGI